MFTFDDIEIVSLNYESTNFSGKWLSEKQCSGNRYARHTSTTCCSSFNSRVAHEFQLFCLSTSLCSQTTYILKSLLTLCVSSFCMANLTIINKFAAMSVVCEQLFAYIKSNHFPHTIHRRQILGRTWGKAHLPRHPHPGRERQGNPASSLRQKDHRANPSR